MLTLLHLGGLQSVCNYCMQNAMPAHLRKWFCTWWIRSVHKLSAKYIMVHPKGLGVNVYCHMQASSDSAYNLPIRAEAALGVCLGEL